MFATSAVSDSSRPTWRAWTALVLLGLPLFMMATDFTAMFLALPAVSADLAPTTTQLLWMVHIGELVAAGTLITMGWLTGRVGPRPLLLAALALYGVASAVAAFAPNAESFLLARVLIGLATAAASPAAIALLRSLFTSARHYGIAFAVVMGAFTVGGALGPPLTGLLLDHFWWGAVFLANVPVAALGFVVGLWLFPGAAERTTDRIDMISVVVSIAAVTLTVFGLQEIADRGFSVPYALVVVAGIVLGGWFVRRQRRVNNPLLDLELFSMRVLRILAAFYVLSSVAFLSVDFVVIQYLQIVAGVPTSTLGLILAVPGGAAILSTALTPLLTRRFSPAMVMAAGIGTAVLSTALVLIALAMAPSTLLIAVGLTIMSFSMGPPMVLGAQLMVTSVPKKQSGPVAAIQDISASLGSTAGIGVLGSLAMAVFGRGLTTGAPDAVTGADLDAATDSPGGAIAVAESIGGTTGEAMLPVIHDAWSWAAIVAYAAALAVGVVTMVITVRGLRGAQMPSDDESDDDAVPMTPHGTSARKNGAPEDTVVRGWEPPSSAVRRAPDSDRDRTPPRPPAR